MIEPLDPGSARLTLNILGPVQVLTPRTSDASALTTHPKGLAVLVYLLLVGDGSCVSREGITGVFWPDADDRHGRGSLRQVMRVLRATLGADSLVDRGTEYVGVADGVLTCDAAAFEMLLDRGRHLEAMRLYRGDLLDGFPFRGGHAWDEWLEGRRAHYRDLAGAAAWGLAESAEHDGDRAAAASWGKTAVGLSPRNETALCKLIELLARVGDRSGAFRAYRGLVQWLDDEFGVQPSPEMRRCIERLRREPDVEAPTDPPRRAPADRRHDERRAAGPAHVQHERRLLPDRRSDHDRRGGTDRRDPLDGL